MPELGHIAYYVRNLERSVAFYQKVVGLNVVARIFNGRAAVLSGGSSHHELLLIQVSTGDGPLAGRRIGLYHTGWKVGASLDDLRAALDRAQLHGTPVDGTANHQVMFSLYLRDPDDNEVELFVDNPSHDWRHDNGWMEAPVQQLDLSRLQPHEKVVTIAPVAAAPNTANVQPPLEKENGDDEHDEYDEAENPDSLSYWLKASTPNQAASPQMPVAEEAYDRLDDPDDIEYWLKTASGAPVALADEEQNNGEVYDGLDDPDDIEYWLKTIQTPSRNVQADQASQVAKSLQEQHDTDNGNGPYTAPVENPDELEYWLKTASNTSCGIPETPPENAHPYDELKDPDAIGHQPTKAA